MWPGSQTPRHRCRSALARRFWSGKHPIRIQVLQTSHVDHEERVETEQTRTWCNHIWKCAADSAQAMCAVQPKELCVRHGVCVHNPSYTQQLPPRGYEPPAQQKKYRSARPARWSQRRTKCSATGGAGFDFRHAPPCCTRLGYEHVVRARLLKSHLLCTNSWSTKLFAHLVLSLRTFPGPYSYFRIGGGPSMEQSGLFFCVPSF